MPLRSWSRKQPPLARCSDRWPGVVPCLMFAFIGVVIAEGGGGEVGAVGGAAESSESRSRSAGGAEGM